MKKLGKLKLNHISKVEMEKREMGQLAGGSGDCSGSCACGCDGGTGGSSTSSNRNANNTDYTPYSGFSRVDGFWNTDCI